MAANASSTPRSLIQGCSLPVSSRSLNQIATLISMGPEPRSSSNRRIDSACRRSECVRSQRSLLRAGSGANRVTRVLLSSPTKQGGRSMLIAARMPLMWSNRVATRAGGTVRSRAAPVNPATASLKPTHCPICPRPAGQAPRRVGRPGNADQQRVQRCADRHVRVAAGQLNGTLSVTKCSRTCGNCAWNTASNGLSTSPSRASLVATRLSPSCSGIYPQHAA